MRLPSILQDHRSVATFCLALQTRFGIAFMAQPIHGGVICAGEYVDTTGQLLAIMIKALPEKVECVIQNNRRQHVLYKVYTPQGLSRETTVKCFIERTIGRY